MVSNVELLLQSVLGIHATNKTLWYTPAKWAYYAATSPFRTNSLRSSCCKAMAQRNKVRDPVDELEKSASVVSCAQRYSTWQKWPETVR